MHVNQDIFVTIYFSCEFEKWDPLSDISGQLYPYKCNDAVTSLINRQV